jgi:hypothetical protein
MLSRAGVTAVLAGLCWLGAGLVVLTGGGPGGVWGLAAGLSGGAVLGLRALLAARTGDLGAGGGLIAALATTALVAGLFAAAGHALLAGTGVPSPPAVRIALGAATVAWALGLALVVAPARRAGAAGTGAAGWGAALVTAAAGLAAAPATVRAFPVALAVLLLWVVGVGWGSLGLFARRTAPRPPA